jgi:hypothetical protein
MLDRGLADAIDLGEKAIALVERLGDLEVRRCRTTLSAVLCCSLTTNVAAHTWSAAALLRVMQGLVYMLPMPLRI